MCFTSSYKCQLILELLRISFYLHTFLFFYQWTPLHVAVREDHDYTVKCLVKKGADMNIKDTKGVGQTMLVNTVDQHCWFEVEYQVLNKLTCPSHPHVPCMRWCNKIHPRVYQILDTFDNNLLAIPLSFTHMVCNNTVCNNTVCSSMVCNSMVCNSMVCSSMVCYCNSIVCSSMTCNSHRLFL